MRKYLLGVMSAVTICLISASAQAEWYLGAHGGVSIASDTNPSYDVLNVNVPLGFDASYDTGYFFNGVVGYGLSDMPIRLEGEVFTLSNDADYTFADGDRGKGGSTYTGFLANVYYDIENKSDFTPYLGGGLGYTGAELNDDFGEDLSDNVFAWHLDFGVAYAAADNFFIDLQYRYFDASSASDNYSTVGDIAGVSWDFSSNIIMIGLRYEFK